MKHYGLLFILVAFGFSEVYSQSWKDALDHKEAELVLVWYDSNPFIYEDYDKQLRGLEYDLLMSFKRFLRREHNVELTLNWKKADSFSEIIPAINKSPLNHIGVSAFSITEKRKKSVRFTDSYLPDITVLISSKGTPIVKSNEEIYEMITSMQAITIRGTTYEKMLKTLEDQIGVDLQVKYIKSSENILDHVSAASNRYAFIDLPVYLMRIRDGEEFTRQNFFTVQGLGYGFTMPNESDWYIPMNEFLRDENYRNEKAKNISSYISPELYDFIENLYEGDQLGTSILTKEKEMQLALIKNANLKLQEGQSFINILTYGFILAVILLASIAYLFYKNSQNTRVLMDQKIKIEQQQQDIRGKNDKLINRNAQLISINEEKNNLVNILAHDLRSPLAQIIGLSDLIVRTHEEVPEEDRELIGQIHHSAEQINELINKILNSDTLEGNHIPVLKESVSVNGIINEVVRQLRVLADKKDITLTVEECSSSEHLYSDHLLLFQILDNLVSNAIKYSEKGSEVFLEANCEKEKVVFKVKDSGPGFSDDDKTKMFNKFQPLSAKPTANEPSIGLGLSIVKRYIRELGGEVSLESEIGKGTVFSVILPKKA